MVFDDALGFGDLGFVASAAQRSIVFSERLAGRLQLSIKFSCKRLWLLALFERPLVFVAEMFEVVVELAECSCECGALFEQIP